MAGADPAFYAIQRYVAVAAGGVLKHCQPQKGHRQAGHAMHEHNRGCLPRWFDRAIQ